MDNTQRDKMFIEMHADIKVVVGKINDHHETLYAEDGVVNSVTLLKERQENCPARLATTVQSKRLSLGNVMLGITIVTVLINIALTVWQNSS